MGSGRVDLTSCDTEPIHEIGSIQPDGALLALDAANLKVTHFSKNLSEYLPRSPENPLGMALGHLIGDHLSNELQQRELDPAAPHLLRPWFIGLPKDENELVECLPHRQGNSIILELLDFQKNQSEVWQQDALRQRIISELLIPDTLESLAAASANIIREVTGFDRVMIYRFAEDKHGQVIAESTSRSDSFMGMHYPASDIPDPARRHFTLNLIRAIPDINAVPVPILTGSGEKADTFSTAPLDLTFSKLRAVAPVHVEYLANMGVGASMSISLVSNDELWGLVACHHYSRHYVASSNMRFCEMLGGTISALLQNIENTSLLKRSIAAERAAYDVEAIARENPDLHALMENHAQTLMDLVEAQAMIFSVGGKQVCFGTVPDVAIDFSPLADAIDDGVSVTDHLGSLTTLSAEQISLASGAAYLELSEDGTDYLVLLREQFEHVVKWAGKPNKVEIVGSDGVKRLSPRGSFALWRQERLGRSKPFSHIDREVLRIVRRALFALNSLNRERAAVLAQRQAEADTTRLRMTLLEAARKSSMGELAGALAHELNQPLAAISNYVSACRQELQNCGVTVPDDVLELIDEAVDESSRAADLVRRLRNFISTGELMRGRTDIHHVIRQAAELAVISTEGNCMAELHTDFDDRIPDLFVDSVQIGQVILNLVSNSIDAIGEQPGDIVLSTRLIEESVEVSVQDSGPGIPPDADEMLFEPFHSSTTQGMGMGLSLCRSIIEAHSGRIWNAGSNKGADMRFVLPVDGEI